jgi:hypothetical protein
VELRDLVWIVLGVAGLVGVIMGVRHARLRGWLRTRRGTCAVCGVRGAVMHASYYQNTGMLIMRQSRHFAATVCRGCSANVCGKMTLHCMVLGWWGMISMVLNPLFIANNLVVLLVSLTLPGASAMVRETLEAQREYALNLLASKDEETVIEVLRASTRASDAEVRAFVRRLRAAA